MGIQRLSIITPCFNAEEHIEETARSVIDQTAFASGEAELEYIICDGGSTDRTVQVIESLGCKSIKVLSERDGGMYDALAKGLKLVTGDFTTYINAGDYYHKCAFGVVLRAFENPATDWITGCQISYNDQSEVIDIRVPYLYRKRFFECGYYNGRLLPFLQQESTFWRSSLNALIDGEVLSKFRLAGDYYLWRQFSTRADLKVVFSYLGGFKFHPESLSSTHFEKYQAELSRIATVKPTPADYLLARLDSLVWLYASDRIKFRLNRDRFVGFEREKGRWV